MAIFQALSSCLDQNQSVFRIDASEYSTRDLRDASPVLCFLLKLLQQAFVDVTAAATCPASHHTKTHCGGLHLVVVL